MKGRGQREDRLAMLDRRYPAGGEGTTVSDPVHQINQRHRGIAWPDEVSVQRVPRAVVRHGPASRDQGLASHLSAEYPLPPLAGRAAAAEDVELDLLEVEQLDHGVQCLAHRRDIPFPRKFARCALSRDDIPPTKPKIIQEP